MAVTMTRVTIELILALLRRIFKCPAILPRTKLLLTLLQVSPFNFPNSRETTGRPAFWWVTATTRMPTTLPTAMVTIGATTMRIPPQTAVGTTTVLRMTTATTGNAAAMQGGLITIIK